MVKAVVKKLNGMMDNKAGMWRGRTRVLGSKKLLDTVLLFCFWFFPMTLFCQKACLTFPGLPMSDGLIHDEPENQGVSNALAKARMVAGVEWTPINDVPSVYSASPYLADGHYLGLPYSLTQKVNGYVGLDVSFYTFLTALHNPRSVMYTENLKLPPYNGFDAASYYGSVCATSVWYVLGIKAPYYTRSIRSINALTKREDLPLDSIRLCDVLWKTGHVAMIYDIGRDVNNSIQKVVVFETTTRSRLDSKLVEYSIDGFINLWNSANYIIYRPKDLSDNPAPEEGFCWLNGHLKPQFAYNEDLCTNHGDCVAYPVGDSVVINILSDNYSVLELYKDGNYYHSVNVGTNDVVFYDLPYGSYQARLTNGTNASDFVSFEVIDINISYVIGDKLTVYFSSANAVPEFMSLGDARECPDHITIFTSTQIAQGSTTVNLNGAYLKVHFRGRYGRVSNKLIRIE